MSRKTYTTLAAFQCAFEAHNAKRSPAWRWELAQRLELETINTRPGRSDAHVARAVKFLRRLSRCRTPGRLAQLRQADPDLFTAMEFNAAAGWQRTLLEARLLATMPHVEIGRLHGLTEGAVQTFADMFFDIHPHLGARDWILIQAIGLSKPREPLCKFYQREIKLFGYFLGPLVVELLAKLAFDEHGNLREDPVDLSTGEGRLAALCRLAILARMPGKSLPYILDQLRTLQHLREIMGKTAKQAPTVLQVLADVAAASASASPAAEMSPGAALQKQLAAEAERRATAEHGQDHRIAVGA